MINSSKHSLETSANEPFLFSIRSLFAKSLCRIFLPFFCFFRSPKYVTWSKFKHNLQPKSKQNKNIPSKSKQINRGAKVFLFFFFDNPQQQQQPPPNKIRERYTERDRIHNQLSFDLLLLLLCFCWLFLFGFVWLNPKQTKTKTKK